MSLFSPRQNQVERYNSIRTTSAILGIPIPIIFGQGRVAGKLIWYGDFTSTKAKNAHGGKGLSKGDSQYVYTASVIAALAQGQISSLLNVWDSTGRFVLLGGGESFTVGTGGGPGGTQYTVLNAAVYGNDQGVAVQQTYSVGPFNDYGAPGAVTLAGTQGVPMTKVSGTPVSGQYSVNPATGVYTFAAADSGAQVVIAYSYYRYQIETQEITIVPFSGPFTVTVDNSTAYQNDNGVAYYPAGTALAKISSGTPTVGQYKQSGAVYTFAAADAGAAIIISYTYKDPNTDTNAPTMLNLTLVSGAQGQSPLSYMSSKHPTQALGYSQIAYIFSSGLYLGYTPNLPNYSYEVAGPFQFGGGIVDANPADCIGSLLTDTGFGAGFPSAFLPSGATGLGATSLARACWTANSFFISPVIENQDSCASIAGKWLEAGMVGAFYSEQLLKFVPYSDTTAVGNGVTYSPSTTPVANLTDDNFLVESKDEDPVKLERGAWQDAFNRAQVTYNIRANDYNAELVYEQDEQAIAAFGLRIEDPQQYDFITTLAAAQYAASMRVQRSVYIRNIYTFRLPAKFAWLEPMDVVTITDPGLGLAATPVRITKIDDDPIHGLEVTAEDFLWGTAAPAFNPKSVNGPFVPDQGQADPGLIATPVIFEATSRINQALAYQIWIGAAGVNPNWGGCHVYISRDNTNFVQIFDIAGNQAINAPARMGVTTTTLPYGADPDTTDSVTVDLSESAGQLGTGTAADANNLATLCLVDTELFSYETATLVGSSTYQLGTLLRRGQLGTTIAAHSIGAPFLRIDNAVFKYQLDPTYLNQPIYFKFTSFNLYGNQEQSLASVTSYTFTPTGLQAPSFGTAPLAVVQYATKTNGSSQSIIRINDTGGNLTRQDGSLIPIKELVAVGAPILTLTVNQTGSGSGLPARTEYFKATYVDFSGAESPASAEVSKALAAGTYSQVVLSGGSPPVGVAGYNVYGATSSGAEKLQTPTVIAVGSAWNETSAGLATGGASAPSTDSTGEPLPVASTSFVGGGSLGARTRYVRVALVRNGLIYGISAEVSQAIGANNLLYVGFPTAVPGYDGWTPLVGSASGSEVLQGALVVPFGTNWTEPTGGATLTGAIYSDDGLQGGLHLWGLSPGATYYLYPYYNTVTQLIELPPGPVPTAASQAAAAVQNALGNFPLSNGAIQITTPSGSGGSGGGGGGGGRGFL